MIRQPLDLEKPLIVRKPGIQVQESIDGEMVTRELAIGEPLNWRGHGLSERSVTLLYQAWKIDVVGSPTAPVLAPVADASSSSDVAAPTPNPKRLQRHARAAGA